MRLKQIILNEEGVPSEITVGMSTREAALLARMVGKTNGSERTRFQQDGAEIGSEIYDCLSGEFFNRFWEDGVNEVPR